MSNINNADSSDQDLGNRAKSVPSHLNKSNDQQHVQDFFEKFLESSMKNRGPQFMMDSDKVNSQDSTNPIPDRASISSRTLPQAHVSTTVGLSPYMISPLYNTFGMNMNNERDDINLVASTSSAEHTSVSLSYNNLNLGTDLGGAYNNGSPTSFLNLLNNQPNTSDSSDTFSSNLNLIGDCSRNLLSGRKSESTEFNKTYSSVLHSSLNKGFNVWQQQPQQTFDNSLFDMQQQLSSITRYEFGRNEQQAVHVPGVVNRRQQIIDMPNCSSNEFLIDQTNRRTTKFQTPTSLPHQSIKHNSLSRTFNNSAAVAPIIANRHQIGMPKSHGHNSSTNEKTTSSYSSNVNETSRRRHKSPFFGLESKLGEGQPGFKLDAHGTGVTKSDDLERFSRKVFVGGLPPDIDEEEIKASFRRFGALVVDWPHKAESKSYFPPKGYAFLLFQEELSVQALIDSCYQEGDKLYLCVSSPTMKDKPVQIRPWLLSDSDFVLDSTLALDPRKTVFVGGVPRPLKASELARTMNNLYGGVCYAGIDTDPELKYPKGAGRVAFSNHKSYIAAISARFVHIHHSEIEKRVEVKPYVLDDQCCDECQGSRCNDKFAPFFCANITCLRYYCETCWSTVHTQPGKEFHKPLVKECGDRPRGGQSFKW